MIEKIFREFAAYAESEKLPIEAIAFGDEKKVFWEHRFVPDQPRNIYSHTKSFMSTAAGIAIDEGKLSLEDKLADFFPEAVPENAQEALFDIRLKHLLTMSSGFGKPYLMGADRRAGTGMPDYMAYMLSRPVIQTPGTAFEYSTADSILAGRMVEKAVGVSLSQYLYEKLFSKMDIGHPIWECCPQGHPIGGGGMFLSLKDMMKLGQLYLAGGIWNGEQLVSAEWVAQASAKRIENAKPGEEKNTDWWNCGYGYQFWRSPYPDSYRADGAYGQITMVLPQKGLVVSFQCPEYGDFAVKKDVHERIFSLL